MGSIRLALPAAVAAVLLTGGVAAASPAASQEFRAAHSDRCLSSLTEGKLEFRPVRPVVVAVAGTVVLRNPDLCVFPARPTATAVFTAYSGRTAVDVERQTTGSSLRFEFVLDATLSPVAAQIDRVTVQVCHTGAATSPAPTACGPISTYTP
jgi:hypothetical protein